MQCLASSEIWTPTPLTARRVCTPPPLEPGGGHTRWVEMGWGVNSSEDARHCSVLYICKYFVVQIILVSACTLKIASPFTIRQATVEKTEVKNKNFGVVKQEGQAFKHKVHIYLEFHSVCPLVRIGIGTPLTLPQASESPPPEPTGGGGHTRLRVSRWGSPNFDDFE
jgi:hypothetical protein